MQGVKTSFNFVLATGNPVGSLVAPATFLPQNADEEGNIFANLIVTVGGIPTLITGITPTDNQAAVASIPVAPFNLLYDEAGNNWDRYRGTTDRTILASAARVATNNSADFINFNHKGGVFLFDVTVVPGVDTVTLEIQGKDPVSGTYYTILSSAAIVAVSFNVLTVFPGITAVANVSASDILPRVYRARVVHSGAGSFTYSIGNSLVL